MMKKREKSQVINNRTERRDITIDYTVIKSIVRRFSVHLYANAFENLVEVVQFLVKYDLQK